MQRYKKNPTFASFVGFFSFSPLLLADYCMYVFILFPQVNTVELKSSYLAFARTIILFPQVNIVELKSS